MQHPFSEEEVRAAIDSSYAEGAPGPDDLSFLFLQKFWAILKVDIMNMFHCWWEDKLDLYRLNFAMTSLIPKENDAREMRNLDLLAC